MTPDEETVRCLHEGGLALAKVHQTVSMAKTTDTPLSLSKSQEKALEKLLRLSQQIVTQAELMPIAKRRPRS